MPTSKLTTTEKVIIALFFALYMLGCHFLDSLGSGEPKQWARREDMTVAKTEREEVNRPKNTKVRKVRSLQDWPLDLGKYFYTIDIAPGYEMEDEVFEVVGKSGDNLLVKRLHDWPDISGHFEWYCNEKLTSTQQLYDYVVAHRKAIVRQMEEVRSRGIGQITDEASYFQDHYDEYMDDPEDEIRFPPEIFDTNEE
jgi:hypothetical protein